MGVTFVHIFMIRYIFSYFFVRFPLPTNFGRWQREEFSWIFMNFCEFLWFFATTFAFLGHFGVFCVYRIRFTSCFYVYILCTLISKKCEKVRKSMNFRVFSCFLTLFWPSRQKKSSFCSSRRIQKVFAFFVIFCWFFVFWRQERHKTQTNF